MSKTTITLDEHDLRTLAELATTYWLGCEDSHDEFIKNNDDMPHKKWVEKNVEFIKQKTNAWNVKETLQKALTRSITK